MLHYPQLGGAGSDWTIEGHVWVYSLVVLGPSNWVLGTTGYRVILVLDTGSTEYWVLLVPGTALGAGLHKPILGTRYCYWVLD